MSIGVIITIVLAILTGTGVTDLSVFQIFLPIIIEVVIDVVLIVLFVAGVFTFGRKL